MPSTARSKCSEWTASCRLILATLLEEIESERLAGSCGGRDFTLLPLTFDRLINPLDPNCLFFNSLRELGSAGILPALFRSGLWCLSRAFGRACPRDQRFP